MNLEKQAKGSVRDLSWIFISRLKVTQRDAQCVRDNPIWVGPSGDDININEGRINLVKMYRRKSDSASESFRSHDSAFKILQIKIH